MLILKQATKRPDIEGLRALSILFVFAFHLFPTSIPGGFIGVDIFFVISGFLITQHLHTEYVGYGTISVSKFYARRIRRLLPASYFVLLASGVAIILFIPVTEWARNFSDISGASVYLANWQLAFSSTGYANLGTSPSIVQQFWSLSVEEQFYLFWPLLLIGIFAFPKLLNFHGKRSFLSNRFTFIALFLISIGSLFFSYWSGEEFPAESYFFTPSRIWEFAAGALLVFLPKRIEKSQIRRTSKFLIIILNWSALVSILASAWFINSSMIFPGLIALWPVLSVMFMLWAGDLGTNWEPGYLAKFGPVLALGGLSYAIYLWHWPVLVVYSAVTGKAITLKAAVVLVLLTIALSILTKYFVENPLRFGKMISTTRRSLLFALIGSLMIAFIGLTLSFWVTQQIQNSSKALPVFQNSAELQKQLEAQFLANTWGENIEFAPKKLSKVWNVDDCLNVTDQLSIKRCTYGNLQSERTLVVLGDSFAGSYMPGIVDGFTKNDWKVIPLTLEQCPAASVKVSTFNAMGQEYLACTKQQEWVLSQLELIAPEKIVVSNGTGLTEGRLVSGQVGQEFEKEWREGLADYLKKLRNLGFDVTLLAQSSSHNCSISVLPQDCEHSEPRENYSGLESSVAASTDTKYVDSRPWFCNSTFTICPEMIAGTYVLGDPWHLSDGYSRRLANVLYTSIVD